MGTRGLLGAIVRGQKKGSYNHFDSYPSALGLAIVAFIRSLTEEQIQEMVRRYEEVEWYGAGPRLMAIIHYIITHQANDCCQKMRRRAFKDFLSKYIREDLGSPHRRALTPEWVHTSESGPQRALSTQFGERG
ncbi:hypothetical protein LTR37_019583 [Vermiconidia calcicola]|uniref:Uncharacterized protein n=1 Tax=Vermiconidia calcicola TaxID=1690605 RepID=A0ACC3MFI1_9PEZI|nr:hypothetical protein LTR37_019583 [Vermiconidia calcicola]